MPVPLERVLCHRAVELQLLGEVVLEPAEANDDQRRRRSRDMTVAYVAFRTFWMARTSSSNSWRSAVSRFRPAAVSE